MAILPLSRVPDTEYEVWQVIHHLDVMLRYHEGLDKSPDVVNDLRDTRDHWTTLAKAQFVQVDEGTGGSKGRSFENWYSHWADYHHEPTTIQEIREACEESGTPVDELYEMMSRLIDGRRENTRLDRQDHDCDVRMVYAPPLAEP